MYASAITTACKDGKISRAEVRKDVAKVSLKSTILGGPMKFTAQRRRRRRQVPHLQDRQRQVRDGRVVVESTRGAAAVTGRAPSVCTDPMNWNLFLTELVAGVTHGSVYALIALGYSMVYGILKLLNFAHGDVYMVGSFIGFGIITVFGGPTNLDVNVVAAALPDVLLRDARRRAARRHDRALRLPAAAERAANRAADHRARRLVLPRERRAARPRRAVPELRQLQLARTARSALERLHAAGAACTSATRR